MFLSLIVCLVLFSGCQTDVYTLQNYIEDTKELFLIETISTSKDVNEPLYYEDMISILKDISHSDEDYLASLSEKQYQNKDILSKKEATSFNQLVYEDLYAKDYFETTFDLGDVIQVDEHQNLSELAPGFYEQNGSFYEVTENKEVKPFEINDFHYEGSFPVDLEESIILPEGSEVNVTPTNFSTTSGLQQLASRYFQFNLKGYKVNGRVHSDGLQVKVSKKTQNQVSIENELSIDNLKCTVDFNLEERQFYFRADYNLKDVLSISKTKTKSESKITLDSFSQLKEKIESLKSDTIVVDDLHLLSFNFPIPSTNKLMHLTLDLSLKIMANGEARITFSQQNKQGSQTFRDALNYLNNQKWDIKPKVEGSLECAPSLSFGIDLGTVHLADIVLQGGIGTQASTKVHYVDQEKQLIETTSKDIDLLSMELLLSQYDDFEKQYVDLCLDVDVYYFGRIQANQKKSLLSNLGLKGSFTPLKKTFSLVHMENHHVVDACTKGEILFNPEAEINVFDISDYQLYLTVGKTVQLTSTKEQCTFSSSNTTVAFVDETGKVKALNPGYATIIVKDESGVERCCLVFVE